MSDRKSKIIHIMSHPPAYDEYRDSPRPFINWDTPDGSWVGMWGYDFSDLIGKAIVAESENYKYEVWQPDLRADKIYSADLSDRMIHRNFPARYKTYIYGIRLRKYIYSKEMLDYAKNENNNNTIFLIPASLFNPFAKELYRNITIAKIIYNHFINTLVLLPVNRLSLNPLKMLHRFLLKRDKNNQLKKIRNLLITNDNPDALNNLIKKYPQINVFKFKFGLDLDFWRSDISKKEARNKLNIPLDKFVILLSQRLIPEYQIDKFMEALVMVNPRKEFICYISGHGTKNYLSYLLEKRENCGLNEIVKFVGYVSNEDLKMYFIASDVFATLPIISAGSTGAIKAMACERPVLHVKTGSTYEYLKDNNAGIFIEPTNYSEWIKVIRGIINGKEIKIVPRENVASYYSWVETAKEVIYTIENAK
jgi:glycosyltransferase involved in cell wall biosynthesis